MKKFALAVLGHAFVAALIFHYHKAPPGVEKEPPLTGWHRSVVKDGPAIAARWQKAIERALAQHRSPIPVKLVVGFMLTESMGKPRALYPETGAAGLLGVRPTVCAELRVRKCDLFNPHTNISLGVQYLHVLERKYGFQGEGLILAYGVGPGRARKILGKKTFRAGGSEYIQKVLYAQRLGKTGSAKS